MINKIILNEGGNVEIDGIAAQRLDLQKVTRSKVVAEIDTALKLINSAFNKAYGVPLWSPKLIKNKEFLSGSAFHFFDLKNIPDDVFVSVKKTVGDIDTMVDKKLADKTKDFLTKAKGKQFGPATLIGFKPNPGQDTFISLWQFNNPPVAVQIDMELVDYSKGDPTEWSKFSHSSAWEDLNVGIKGVFHKYLMRSLTHKDAKERYIQMKTKLKKVNASDLAFAVTGGVRQKFEPVIDPTTKKPAVAPDGLGIYKEIPASESNYETDITKMFAMLIGQKPAKDEVKYLYSFIGLLSLINKYFTAEDKNKITQAFVALLFGAQAQQLYKGDPTTDKREKEIALNKLIEILDIKVDKSSLAKVQAEFYNKYKAESLTEADAPDYKRQGIKHIYNPGSTVEMKDADFLAFIDEIVKNGGTLDNIPITLKVDGAGIRFGKDQSGKPFFMTSRVTNPIYAENIGMFEKYARDNNSNEEQIARAEKYDQALSLIVNSDFIKVLPKDTIVQAEMMYNAMAEQTEQGLKFVNISYDPKKLGKKMTLVPIVASTYSTGQPAPNADAIIKKLVSKSTPEIKIEGTELQHDKIDVSKIVDPIAKMDNTLRAALGSKKKNDPAKAKAKEILTQARQAISNAIINSPNIKGKDKLGKTIEGLVIAMPNGQLAKVTSTEMKGAMAAKKAPTTGGNRTKAAVVTAGSFVGHVGHQKVVDTVIAAAKKLGGDPYVYISSKTGPDDPIPPEVKIATWKKLYPEHAGIFQLITSPDGSAPSPVKKIEKELVLPANSPYKKIVVMVGSDRYEGFKNWLATLEKRMKDPVALAKYGGTQDQVSFDTIEIPRGAALGGIDASFSQLRNVLKDPNLTLAQKLQVWSEGFGNKLDADWIKKLMMISAKGMGIKLDEIRKANEYYQEISSKEKVKESDDFMPTIHDELNPQLFNRETKMSPVVRQKLLDIAEDFKNFLGIQLPNLKDITISGSNAAYNYTPSSDIDLHLIVDIPQADNDTIYRELFDAKKFQYNEQHDYKIKGFDVELYVQNANEDHVSNGIYSVMNDDWVKFPDKINVDVDEENTRSKYDVLKALILKALKANDYDLGVKLRKTLKKYRQVGLHSTGEFGAENLAWKALRTNGYIRKLYDMLNDLKDREFSLESHEQRLTEIDMSPGALKKFSTSNIAKSTSVGFEFEMIVPNMSDPDGGDSEPDYDYDDYVDQSTVGALQRDLIGFFRESNTTRQVERAVEDFSDRLNDFISNQFDEWLADNQDMLYDMYRDWTNLETEEEIKASIDDEDADYDRVIEKMRDQHNSEWDDLAGALEYNDLMMYSDWAREYDFDWPHYTDPVSGEIDDDALREVAQEIKNAVGMPVKSAAGYHAFKSNREPGVWYLETDSSIDASESDGEGGLELVSPPLPLEQALEKLDQVLTWMRNHGAYTDSSTGFHMGVSIPEMENVDYIKLILFLGDKYVLESFGRLGNTYTRSALDKMEIGNAPHVIRTMPGIFDALKGGLEKAALKMLAASLVPRNDKYTSVNIKDKYVEFRSAGGDYLEAIEKIKNTLLRYVRVMAIASDPNDAKQEYAKKLYKLLASAAANEKDLDVIKWFTMYSSGNIAKAELVAKLKQAQAARQTKKNPTPAAQEPTGPWQRWIVFGPNDNGDNSALTAVSARDRQEASRLAFRWGRDNNRVVTGLELDDEELANMIHRNESKEVVTELANKPYVYKADWGRDETIAYFTTDAGIDYQVYIGVEDEEFLYRANVVFYGNETDKITNTGDAFRVLATVALIVKTYLTKYKGIKELEFAADTSEPSRVKLYNALTKMLPKFIPDFRFKEISHMRGADFYYYERIKKPKVKPATQESKGQLNELANKPYTYKIDIDDIEETTAIFKTANNQDYVVVIGTAGGTDEYDAEVSFFAQKGLYGVSAITNTGDAFRVFATVAEILKAYLNKYKSIRSFTFNAEYSEPSRVKLYNTMARIIPKFIPNFKFVGEGGDYSADGIKVYRFEKNKKPKVKSPAQESKGQLNELANKPYPFNFINADSPNKASKALFTTDNGINYRVLMMPNPDEDDNVEIAFIAKINDKDDTLKLTNTGDAFRVFATVASVIKQFLKNNPNINRFKFSADQKEPSRVKLYTAMSKMLPKFIPGWKLKGHNKSSGYTDFRFVRSKEDKPSSLKEYIEISDRPFVWQKDEPKKEFTEMQLACILGGHEYTGELDEDK